MSGGGAIDTYTHQQVYNNANQVEEWHFVDSYVSKVY